MVVALFGLSLVMIVGGVAAVVQGFPYVRLESGLAMVIGGSTAASAGVILLGLAAIAMRLSQLHRAVSESRPVAAPSKAVEGVSLPPPAPVSAGMAGLAGLSTVSAGLRSEPRIDDLPVSNASKERPSTRPRVEEERAAEDEPALPDLLPRNEAPAAWREPRLSAGERAEMADDDLFTPSTSAPETPQPAIEPETPAAKETAEPEAQPSIEAQTRSEGERVVVGTYASGGNTYVMFADGSIEADTPRGRFNFGSLTELKAFVEAGGENNDTRGAA